MEKKHGHISRFRKSSLPPPHLGIPSFSSSQYTFLLCHFFLSESIVDISNMLVSDIQHGDSNCL